MANLINAYAIYNGTTSQYVGDQGVIITLNCDRIQAYSPRQAWLLRMLNPGDGTLINYEVTFAPNSAQLLDANTVPGYWIEADGQDALIDITSVSALTTACDACCGSVPAICTNVYGGAVPSYTPLTLNSFCVYRLDDGSAIAHNQVSLDYTSYFVGTIKMTSHITGVSHYTITSFNTTLPPTGYDVVTAGACSS